MGKNDSKGGLNQLRGVAVKQSPDAPDEKGKPTDPPGDFVPFRQNGDTVKFFHKSNTAETERA